MVEKNAIVLRALLENYRAASWESLLDILPPDELQQVRRWNIEPNSVHRNDFLPEKLLNTVHYTWLKPIIEEFPAPYHSLFLSSLPKKTAAKLADLLPVKLPESPPSLFVKKFLIKLLYQRLDDPLSIPFGFLEKSPLKPFAELPKKQILDVIDLFSLYDLAKEVRQIVDTAQLKRIYACLTERERRFLHLCIQSKEHLTTVKWHIERWDGDKKKFLRLIHQKGLLRLGYALSGQRPQLVFTIMRKLDVGRAEILKKYVKSEEVKEVTKMLVQQLLNVMNFFTRAEGKDES